MTKPAKKAASRTEKERIAKTAEKLIAETYALERQWAELPEETRAAIQHNNPDLAKWFADTPTRQ